MEIEIQSPDHNNFLDFVIEGLENYEKAKNHIDTIDVYNSSISVTYKENHENITELLYVHEHIMDHGLDPFISRADMRNGQTIRYDLED